ncbi:hypothetical protein E2562_001615 [Oryza meyeriana var. granulata]|uniref:Serpin domain-containing protein n=1 Tax=Oryza meyeriana var. granulata TaxID=110450 RepID=A0A6G1CDR5_9ORYZ|nr:hypothetical protein E2562_001615 [Oryza meyeriana var. granulata]
MGVIASNLSKLVSIAAFAWDATPTAQRRDGQGRRRHPYRSSEAPPPPGPFSWDRVLMALAAGDAAGGKAPPPPADVLRLRRLGGPQTVTHAGAHGRHGVALRRRRFVSEEVRRRVNDFVSDATRGLIRDVLPPGSVDSSTVAVLANAVYFKGTWSLPFHPWATFHAPFHLLDGTANDGDGVHRAAFYMLLLLPDSNDTLKLADFYDMAVTTPEFIKKHTPAAKVPVRRFMVPKFKFEASPDMQKLGVTRAFGGGDFSGMMTGGEGLSIIVVYHQATIEVDELGTVAAAATAVVMNGCGSARPPIDFVADWPFLFAIVEEITCAVLFLGHVVNPPGCVNRMIHSRKNS